MWRRLQSPEPSRWVSRLAWPAVVAGVAAAALVLVLRSGEPGGAAARIAFLETPGVAHLGTGPDAALTLGQGLGFGETLETGQSQLVVELSGIGSFALARASALEIGGDAQAPILRLHRGAVWVSVDPRRDRPPFRVIAGDYAVQVVGTSFLVERPAAAEVGVYVWEGTVEVTGPQVTRRLGAGQLYASSGRLRYAADDAGIDLLRQLFGPERVRKAVRLTAAVAAGSAEPPAAPPAATAPAGRTERTGDSEAGAAGQETPDKAKAEVATREVDGGQRRQAQARRGKRDEAERPRRRASRQPAGDTEVAALELEDMGASPGTSASWAEPQDEREAYRVAAATKDPRQAVRRFDAIAERRGAMAEIAEYQAARLSLQFSTAGAARRFKRFIADHAMSPFDPEARISLIECQMKLGQHRAARREVTAFIRRHPDSERLPDLRFVRGELRRLQERDYAGALADYQAALGSRQHRQEALFHVASCQHQLGQAAAARQTLQQYLREFPQGPHADEARRGF